MKLSIVNDMGGLYQEQEVYYSIMGTNSAGNLSFMKSDGTLQECALSDNTVEYDGDTYSDYFFKLSELPQIEFTEEIISARVRIAIGSMMYIKIIEDPSGNITYRDADFTNPNDPSYNIINDKFEFTYNGEG